MAVQMKNEVLSFLQQHQGAFHKLGVKRLGLFGSFVRGEERADSDIDILVEFEPGQKTFDNFIQLAFLLEQLLERRVELVTPESLSPYLRMYILHEIEYVSLGD
ncbi:MAG: nucleotidyltransferase [Caldilineae bacterium]|nr:MAG: nucleotidyltransferase [Caldilineae bacterium]